MTELQDSKHPVITEEQRHVSNVRIKDTGYFAKFSHETGGEYTQCNVTLQPGGRNLLHYHRTFVETFRAIKGKLGIEKGVGNIQYLSPGEGEGEGVPIPMSTVHRFFNDTEEPIEFSCTITPGNPGFEKSIYIVYGLANDGLTDETGVPKSLVHLAVFASLGDISLHGVAGIMNPVLGALYAYARWSGVEKELIERYCPHLP